MLDSGCSPSRKRIHPFFHHDPALAGAVLRILLRAIRTTLRRGSPGAGPEPVGAILGSAAVDRPARP